MDIGVVLQTTPPSARVIDLAKRAESYGFSHVWTFDSHILWEEPFPIFTQILASTRNVMVGPMVTNPITRDWTVTASAFATLNEMFGNRTVIGIGRGDSAVRVINGRPSTLIALREAIHVIRELANGREVDYQGSTLRFPWASKSRVEVWGAGYGPKALARDRRGRGRVHPAARRSGHHRLDDRGGAQGRVGGGARSRRDHDLRRGARLRDARRGPRPRPVPLVRWHGRQPRRRHRGPLRRVIGGPGGAHRLHQGPRGLRLQPARSGGQRPHPVRARRDRRPLLHPGPRGRARAAPASSCGISASTSSPSTSSTTTRTGPCAATARRSSRPSRRTCRRSRDAAERKEIVWNRSHRRTAPSSRSTGWVRVRRSSWSPEVRWIVRRTLRWPRSWPPTSPCSTTTVAAAGRAETRRRTRCSARSRTSMR